MYQHSTHSLLQGFMAQDELAPGLHAAAAQTRVKVIAAPKQQGMQ
jgi:hypothetical protein